MKILKGIVKVVAIVATIAAFIPGPWQPVAAIVAKVAMIASAALEIVSPTKARPPSARGSPTQYQLDPNIGIPMMVGRTQFAGCCVKRETWGTDNMYQGFTSVYSLGPISAIQAFTADKTTINFSGGGGAIGSLAGFMWFVSQLGACPSPVLASPVAGYPGWTASSKMSGLAASHWVLKFDKKGKKYTAGPPQPGVVAQGVLVYDPRKDSTVPGGVGACRAGDESTYVVSETPHLHALTYALGRYQNGKRRFGIGFPATSIDMKYFMDAANVDEANNWKIGGVVYSTDNKWNTLKMMMEAGGGAPITTGGRLTGIQRAPKASIATITGAEVIGAGSVVATQTIRDRINVGTPRYRSEDHGWEYVSADPCRVAAYVAMDGGDRNREYEWTLVQQVKQASQLTFYEIYDAREIGPIELRLKIRWVGLKPGDCATLNIPDMNLINQKCVLLSRTFDPQTGSVMLRFRTETDQKHVDALAANGSAPPIQSLAFDPDYTPPAPTGWTLTTGGLSSSGGTTPTLRFNGPVALAANAEAVEFWYRKTTDADWSVGGRGGPETVRFDVSSVEPGAAYVGRVIYVVNGKNSNPLDLGPTTVESFPAFNTLAEAQAATVSGDVVVLRGYAALGDAPDVAYHRVAVEPAHPGKFSDLSGAWFELIPGPNGVDPRWLGAKGDGVTIDNTALTNWAATVVGLDSSYFLPGKPFLVKSETGTLGVTLMMPPSNVLKVIGAPGAIIKRAAVAAGNEASNGKVLKLEATEGGDYILENFTTDGNEQNVPYNAADPYGQQFAHNIGFAAGAGGAGVTLGTIRTKNLVMKNAVANGFSHDWRYANAFHENITETGRTRRTKSGWTWSTVGTGITHIKGGTVSYLEVEPAAAEVPNANHKFIVEGVIATENFDLAGKDTTHELNLTMTGCKNLLNNPTHPAQRFCLLYCRGEIVDCDFKTVDGVYGGSRLQYCHLNFRGGSITIPVNPVDATQAIPVQESKDDTTASYHKFFGTKFNAPPGITSTAGYTVPATGAVFDLTGMYLYPHSNCTTSAPVTAFYDCSSDENLPFFHHARNSGTVIISGGTPRGKTACCRYLTTAGFVSNVVIERPERFGKTGLGPLFWLSATGGTGTISVSGTFDGELMPATVAGTVPSGVTWNVAAKMLVDSSPQSRIRGLPGLVALRRSPSATAAQRWLYHNGSTPGANNTWTTDALMVAGSGSQIGGQTNLPAIAAAGPRYKYTGPVSFSAPTTTSSTISVGAGSVLLGNTSVSLSGMSVNVTGTPGTQSTFYLYIDNPNYTGGAFTLNATTNGNDLYSSNGRMWLGSATITFPSSGTGTGGNGYTGGGSGPPGGAIP